MCWCRLKECSWKFRHSKLYTLSGVYNLYIFTITPFLIKKNPRHPRRVPHSVFLPRHGPGLRTGDFHNCFAFKWFLVSESFLFEWAPNGESVVKIRIGEKKLRLKTKECAIWNDITLCIGVLISWCVLRRTYIRTMCIETYCVNSTVVYSSKVIQSRCGNKLKDTVGFFFLINM